MSPRLKRSAWVILPLLLLGVWFVLLRPSNLGGSVRYVMIRGTSMVPTYKGGDLVVTTKVSTYAKGDVVAYRVPDGEFGEGIIIIHRIIGGSAAKGFVTQGDGNRFTDDWRPKPTDIVGRPWVHIPRAGLVLGFLHAPLPLASLAAAIVLVFMLFPGKEEPPGTSNGVVLTRPFAKGPASREPGVSRSVRPPTVGSGGAGARPGRSNRMARPPRSRAKDAASRSPSLSQPPGTDRRSAASRGSRSGVLGRSAR
jgi:signal peptidase I